MSKVYTRATARRDLMEHYVYLAENASQETADRFLTQAETSFIELTRQPLMGAPLMLRKPNLAGMRKWHVKRFEKFLIFYLPRPDGVSIVRVLHAAQDWWGMLGKEINEPGGANRQVTRLRQVYRSAISAPKRKLSFPDTGRSRSGSQVA